MSYEKLKIELLNLAVPYGLNEVLEVVNHIEALKHLEFLLPYEDLTGYGTEISDSRRGRNLEEALAEEDFDPIDQATLHDILYRPAHQSEANTVKRMYAEQHEATRTGTIEDTPVFKITELLGRMNGKCWPPDAMVTFYGWGMIPRSEESGDHKEDVETVKNNQKEDCNDSPPVKKKQCNKIRLQRQHPNCVQCKQGKVACDDDFPSCQRCIRDKKKCSRDTSNVERFPVDESQNV